MSKFPKLCAALAGLAMGFAGHSAQAEDDNPLFDGFYGGLAGGYVVIDERWGTAGTGGPAAANLSLDGGAGGLTVGYGWNLGNVLLGVEADGMITAANDSNVCSGMGAVCDIDIDGIATYRARAGLIFGEYDHLTAYVTGGLGMVWYGATNPANPGGSADETDLTYVVGGGLEGYLFDTEWLSTKLEYLFVGLDRTYTYTIGGGTGRLNFNGIHMIKWGWNFHF